MENKLEITYEMAMRFYQMILASDGDKMVALITINGCDVVKGKGYMLALYLISPAGGFDAWKVYAPLASYTVLNYFKMWEDRGLKGWRLFSTLALTLEQEKFDPEQIRFIRECEKIELNNANKNKVWWKNV